MTSVRHTADRATKWMRFIAWALMLMWASFWTPLLVARIFFDALLSARPIQEDPRAFLIQVFLFLSLWVSTVLPWRWEAVGGVVLALESLAFFIWLPVEVPNAIAKTMPVLLLGLAAGILFLASWWRSRTSAIPLSHWEYWHKMGQNGGKLQGDTPARQKSGE